MKIYVFIVMMLLFPSSSYPWLSNPSPIADVSSSSTITSSRDGIPDDYAKFEWEDGWGKWFGDMDQGLTVSDTDKDGKKELVFGNYNGFIHTLEYSSGDYILERKSEIVDPYYVLNDIYSMYITDVDNDGTNEILVGSLDSRLTALNERTFEKEWNSTKLNPWIKKIEVGDVDKDGTKEIVMKTRDFFYVMDSTTRKIEWTRNTPNGNYAHGDVVIGDLEGDGFTEIIVSDISNNIYIINGTTKNVIWTSPVQSFTEQLAIRDIDEDGFVELIANRANGIEVYNGTTKLLKRTLGSAGLFKTETLMHVVDKEGDGKFELAVTNNTGSLFMFNGANINPDIVYTFQDLGLTRDRPIPRALTNDIDNDGHTELILVTSEVGMLDFEEIVITDASTLTVEWSWNTTMFNPKQVFLSDLTGDGVDDIVVSSYSEIVIRNGITHNIIANFSIIGTPNYAILTDIDLDGHAELIIAIDRYVTSYDLITKTQDWIEDIGYFIRCLAVGDTNGDNIPEIVVGIEHKIIVLNSSTHKPKWTSPDILDRTYSVTVGDVDTDGVPEIVAGIADFSGGGYRGYVFVFNGKTYAQEWKSQDLQAFIAGLAVGDIDDDGIVEIVGGGYNGSLTIFNGKDKSVKGYTEYIAGWCRYLRLKDIEGDGITEIVYSNDHGFLAVFNPFNFTLEWLSPDLGGYVDWMDFGDLDNDLQIEVIMASYGYLYQFGIGDKLGDYRLTSLQVSNTAPNEDDEVNVSVVVENIGGVTQNSKLRFTDGTINFEEEQIPSLAPGQKTTITKKWFPAPGMRRLQAKIWPIGDFNWSNNAVWTDIYVNWKPVANLSVNREEDFTENTFIFSDNGSFDDGSIVAFQIDYDDGNISTWGLPQTWSHAYNEDGNYSVKLRGKDDKGLVGDWSIPVNITVKNRVPIASFAYLPLNGTVLSEYEFRSLSFDVDGTIISWDWVFDDGHTAQGDIVKYRFHDDLNYTVNLTVTDNDGTMVSIGQILNVENLPPRVLFNVSDDTVLTFENVIFNAENTTDPDDEKNQLSYIWDFGDGETKNGGVIVNHTYSDNKVYFVTLSVIDDDNRMNETSIAVGVLNRPPIGNFSYSPGNGTISTIFTFDASATDTDGSILSFDWEFGKVKKQTSKVQITYIFPTNGPQIVNLTIKDNDGATVTISKDVMIDNILPKAELFVSSKRTKTGTEVVFKAEVSDSDGMVVLYRWDFNGDGVYDKETREPKVKKAFDKSGKYKVILEIVDDDGGIASNSIDVDVEEDYTLLGAVIGVVIAIVIVVIVMILVIRKRKKNTPVQVIPPTPQASYFDASSQTVNDPLTQPVQPFGQLQQQQQQYLQPQQPEYQQPQYPQLQQQEYQQPQYQQQVHQGWPPAPPEQP